MSQLEIANRLRDTILELEGKRGELAEVLKAEAQAKVEGFQYSSATTDTGRRHDAEARALDHTRDAQDLKAEIDTWRVWVDFYTLLIKHDIYIPLDGCPPREQ